MNFWVVWPSQLLAADSLISLVRVIGNEVSPSSKFEVAGDALPDWI
jgi:hypothetical protein